VLPAEVCAALAGDTVATGGMGAASGVGGAHRRGAA
jgi:hypothetical protein